MGLKEQAPAATLARKLGDTVHVSGLVIRLARLGGAGDRLPEWRCRVTYGSGFGLFWEQTLWHTARHDLRTVARRMEGVARPDSAGTVPAQRGTVRPISGHGRQP